MQKNNDMIQLKIKEMMVQKGIKPTAYQLTKTGIAYKAATHYLSGKSKTIKLEDLYKLCLFFTCTPKELLQVVVDYDISFLINHPLYDWTTPPTIFPMQTIRNFTPQQMALLQAAVDEIEKK